MMYKWPPKVGTRTAKNMVAEFAGLLGKSVWDYRVSGGLYAVAPTDAAPYVARILSTDALAFAAANRRTKHAESFNAYLDAFLALNTNGGAT